MNKTSLNSEEANVYTRIYERMYICIYNRVDTKRRIGQGRTSGASARHGGWKMTTKTKRAVTELEGQETEWRIWEREREREREGIYRRCVGLGLE